MDPVQQILEMARRLPAKDRERLVSELRQDSLATEEPRTHGEPTEGPYAALLEMAGSAHSDFEDVAVDKYKHLGDTFRDRRGIQ